MGRQDFHDRVKRIERGEGREPGGLVVTESRGIFGSIILALIFVGLGVFARMLVDISGGVPAPDAFQDIDAMRGWPFTLQSGMGIVGLGALLMVLGVFAGRMFRLLMGLLLIGAFLGAPAWSGYPALLADVTKLPAIGAAE